MTNSSRILKDDTMTINCLQSYYSQIQKAVTKKLSYMEITPNRLRQPCSDFVKRSYIFHLKDIDLKKKRGNCSI